MILTSAVEGQGFVSIDGKRTYMNLFENSDRTSTHVQQQPQPTRTQPPAIVGTGSVSYEFQIEKLSNIKLILLSDLQNYLGKFYFQISEFYLSTSKYLIFNLLRTNLFVAIFLNHFILSKSAFQCYIYKISKISKIHSISFSLIIVWSSIDQVEIFE